MNGLSENSIIFIDKNKKENDKNRDNDNSKNIIKDGKRENTETKTFCFSVDTNFFSGSFLAAAEDGFITGLKFVSEKTFAETAKEGGEAVPSFLEGLLKTQLQEYFSGERKSFTVPLKLYGTEFQLQVWKNLLQIPWGQVKTYRDIGFLSSSPKGARAVGSACNKNPVMILVPCHRVVGTGGKLTGYAGGLELKKILLELEGVYLG